MTHRSIGRLIPLAALSLLVSGCSLLDPGACTANFEYGLRVFVRDSATGAWAASGARLVAIDRDGSIDSSGVRSGIPELPGADSLPLFGAGEHPGTFRVVVSKAGYRDWVREGVRVRDGACHVETVELRARLQR